VILAMKLQAFNLYQLQILLNVYVKKEDIKTLTIAHYVQFQCPGVSHVL